MSIFYWVIIITFISGVIGTGTGGAIGALAKNVSSKVIAMLLCFASGVMLSIVCLDLLAEAIAPTGYPTLYYLIYSVLGVILGYLVVYYLNYYIDTKKNEESGTVSSSDMQLHVHLKSAGIILALAIALHNLPEGLVIGVSYAGSEAILGSSGLAVAIVIGLHNIPEGIAVSVPLVASGISPVKATLIAATSGLPTVVGAMIGYSIGSLGPVAQSLSLAFAAGAMLYVVFGELFPEAAALHRSRFLSYFTLLGIVFGIIVIYI